MSEGVIASTHGLFELSSTTVVFLALLSLLRSRILLDSPLTWFALAKPAELDPEWDSVVVFEAAVDATLGVDVSIVRPGFGDLPRPARSSSTQPAGVGGTGPKLDEGPRLDESWGGRRVGGDTILSEPETLCDLD